MDLSLFGLHKDPFLERDPRNPWLSEPHRRVIGELAAGMEAAQGLTLLVGPLGSGKTTLARHFAAGQGDKVELAYLSEAGPGLRHLLAEVAEQLNRRADASDAAQGSVVSWRAASDDDLLETVRGMVLENAARGVSTLVVIDDAHELPAASIGGLAHLFGRQAAEPTQLHLLLVGEEGLLEKMGTGTTSQAVGQLLQVCRLDVLGPEDSFRFLADTLSKAGAVVERIFSEEALALLVTRGSGISARLATLASTAMGAAATAAEVPVTAAMVEAAVANLGTEDGLEADDEEAEAPVRQATAELSGGGRRRLLLWAAGFIAVVVGFTLTMSVGGRPLVTPPPVERPTASPPQVAKLMVLRPEVEAKAAAPAKAVPLPAPAARTPVVKVPAPAPRPVPQSAPRVISKTKLPIPAAAKAYTVQVGAFRTRRNAESVVARLARSSSVVARVNVNTSGPATVYRVFSGGFATESEASRHALNLRKAGFNTYVRKTSN
ncbi:MAG: AAA family ATPase [Deltaproteobacteria bacterium]